MRVVLQSLVVLILLVTPLLSNFLGLDFEQSKVAFFVIVVNLAALVWLGYLIKQRKTLQFKLTLIHTLVLIFVVTLAITSYFGLDWSGSLIGRPPYFQGLIIYLELYLFYLIIATCQVKLKLVALVISLAATIVSLGAINQFLQALAARPIGSFGQPDLYAGFLILALPFVVFCFNSIKGFWPKLGHSAIVFVVVLAIVVSQSRTAIILLFLVGLLTLWQFLPKLRLYLIILALTLASLLTYLALPRLVETEWVTPQSQQWLIHNSPEKRLYIWLVSYHLILARPWTGYGLDNLELVFNHSVADIFPPSVSFGVINLNIDRAHSYSLDLLFYGGVGALVIWLVLLGAALKKSSQPPQKNVLIIYLIWSQFEVQSIAHLILLWGIIGLIERTS